MALTGKVKGMGVKRPGSRFVAARFFAVLVAAMVGIAVANAVRGSVSLLRGGSNEPILAAPAVKPVPGSTSLDLSISVTDPGAAGKASEGTIRIVRAEAPGTKAFRAYRGNEDPDRLPSISLGKSNQSWALVQFFNSRSETVRFRFAFPAQNQTYRVELTTSQGKVLLSAPIKIVRSDIPVAIEAMPAPLMPPPPPPPPPPLAVGSAPAPKRDPIPLPPSGSNEPILAAPPTSVSARVLVNTEGLTLGTGGNVSHIVIQETSLFDQSKTTSLPPTTTVGVNGSNQVPISVSGTFQSEFLFGPSAKGKSYTVWTYRVVGGVAQPTLKTLKFVVP